MLIYLIDDEPPLLRAEERIIRKARPEAEVLCFNLAQPALRCVTEERQQPDAVFCDIRMPGMSGLQFAVQLRAACPSAKVIFVTGYEEYAVEAFRVKAHGYLLKPLTVEQVDEELRYWEQTPVPQQPEKKLQVRCFGYFEVFWDRKPLQFQRYQTKELLACLIDRRGDACTAEQIAAELWPEENDLRAMKNRIRVLLNDLRNSLKQIGMERLILRQNGSIAVDRDLLDCDFYRMLAGDALALNSFTGQYMQQYSWAEMTAGLFYRDF